MFEFESPWVFMLLPFPWLVSRFTGAVNIQRQQAVQVPFMDDLLAAGGDVATGVGSPEKARLSWRWWLALLCWLLLVIAIAGPRWLGEPVPQQRSGRELMLAIDLSNSMKARDFEFQGQRLNRLMATQLVASDFIQRRAGDRIGLVLFGEQAYLQAPLTWDRTTVQRLLDEAQIGLAGGSTAIGDAIGLTVKRLRETDNSERVMVLLTDGANTAGALEPLQAAKLAAEEGVKVYTIGVGSDTHRGGNGLFNLLGRSQVPELDESTLKAIAQQTGGRYYRARDLQELVGIYDQLDQLEPVTRSASSARPVQAFYSWPLAAALLLLLTLSLLLVTDGIAVKGRKR
ncbi:MAG: VWA domain-containing protein [Marinobacterium sp.]|nr:VWA domain-containing protein [Marinobacterium sp.]